MAINLDKPQLWKKDIAQSVDMYNDWFLRFAPTAFRSTRVKTTINVENTLKSTDNLNSLDARTLEKHPHILPTLRMCTCPPLAVDRLMGLSGVSKNLVSSLDKKSQVPPRMSKKTLDLELNKIIAVIMKLLDRDIFVWFDDRGKPKREEIHRAALIVADRLCGSVANPIIRNAQEQRQLALIARWLEARGYSKAKLNPGSHHKSLPAGQFAYRMNVKVGISDGSKEINIPIDVVVMPKSAKRGQEPILIEAKSAGDFTNVNKRRKEEATKMEMLKRRIGKNVRFVLFLCGYFDTGYLGFEAGEGIDWIWEHRIDDLAQLGL
jgi:hypothetical protein